jgi:hypothetical protein
MGLLKQFFAEDANRVGWVPAASMTGVLTATS